MEKYTAKRKKPLKADKARLIGKTQRKCTRDIVGKNCENAISL